MADAADPSSTVTNYILSSYKLNYTDAVKRVRSRLRSYTNHTFNISEITNYLNDACQEFSVRTLCNRNHDTLEVIVDQKLYDVPPDCIKITRAEWDGNPLTIATTEEMDKRYGANNWRNRYGSEITHIVQDAEGYPQIRIYPYLSDGDDIGHIVTGTDSNKYKCIVDHTSDSDSKPITGSDYADYWEVYTGGRDSNTWVTSTDYYEYNDVEIDYAYLPARIPIVTTGTDSVEYMCILDHIAATANKPVTGGSYSTYWSEYAGDVDKRYYSALTWTENMEYPGYQYDIPPQYQNAIIDYAVNECLKVETQKNQDPWMGSIHENRFERAIDQCKTDFAMKLAVDKSARVWSRPFII